MKPHYVYVRRDPESFTLVIMSKKQETQELPLTADLAMKFSKDFLQAAIELHKKEVTQAGNQSTQMDLLKEERAMNVGNGTEPNSNRAGQ